MWKREIMIRQFKQTTLYLAFTLAVFATAFGAMAGSLTPEEILLPENTKAYMAVEIDLTDIFGWHSDSSSRFFRSEDLYLTPRSVVFINNDDGEWYRSLGYYRKLEKNRYLFVSEVADVSDSVGSVENYTCRTIELEIVVKRPRHRYGTPPLRLQIITKSY